MPQVIPTVGRMDTSVQPGLDWSMLPKKRRRPRPLPRVWTAGRIGRRYRPVREQRSHGLRAFGHSVTENAVRQDAQPGWTSLHHFPSAPAIAAIALIRRNLIAAMLVHLPTNLPILYLLL